MARVRTTNPEAFMDIIESADTYATLEDFILAIAQRRYDNMSRESRQLVDRLYVQTGESNMDDFLVKWQRGIYTTTPSNKRNNLPVERSCSPEDLQLMYWYSFGKVKSGQHWYIKELDEDTADTMYEPPDIMRILGVGKNTVYKLLDSGALGAIRVGRSWKVSKTNLDHFLKNGGGLIQKEEASE